MNDLAINPEMCINCSNCEYSCPNNAIKVENNVPLFCMNCSPDKANCLKACPTEAIESLGGAIILNQEKCIGCGACEESCPIGAINIDKQGRANKCNFCFNQDSKDCIESCPTNALTDDIKSIASSKQKKFRNNLENIF